MFDDRTKEMFKLVEGAFIFGHVLGIAMDKPLYIAACHRNPQLNLAVSYSSWVGKTTADVSESRAPHIAQWKLATLMQQLPVPNLIMRTPDANWGHSVPYCGGLRLMDEWADFSVVCSKLDENFDEMVSAFLLYNAMVSPLRLHHVGFRHATMESYKQACARTGGIVRPASDHQRTYFPLSFFPSNIFIEHQFWPNGPFDSAMHIDVQIQDTEEFLNFYGKCVGVEPEFWEHTRYEPSGMVVVTPSDYTIAVEVMAREQWISPEDFPTID